MLDFRGVLGLIHTKISVSCLELAEDWRTELQNFPGIHQLVVIIHLLLLLQGLTIGMVQGGKVGHTLHFHLRQLLLRGDHLVFYIGNGGLYRLDGAL